jgi:GT2 family glycosyltransferase/glycosyltransferase involved in cell wall biosynthesis
MNSAEEQKLQDEIINLQNQLIWYRETYETRSIFGILKDRLLNNFKKKKDGNPEITIIHNNSITETNKETNTNSLVLDDSHKIEHSQQIQKTETIQEVTEPEFIYYFPKNRHEKLTEFYKVKPFFFKRNEKKFNALIEKEVDIIVPIYNGLPFLKTLIPQILERSDLPFRLILVNDCSPDKEVKLFLETFSSQKNVTIINNKTNLGFTGSVNKALREIKNDVVILNTDTEVPFRWLSRLFNPIFTDPTVATVTPFSNCATIASFPKFNDNPIFENLTVDKIDDIFSTVVKPSHIEMPTGIGFCMAMSKSALEIVGILDEERFPKGYGEEVDWCRRAKKKGLKNVFIPNLFIYHKHGGSFDSKTKSSLSNSHQQTLDILYPEFSSEVASFMENSIQNHIRNFLLLLTCSGVAKKTVVYFDHELGGGANIYTDNLIRDEREEKVIICISFIHPNHNIKKRYSVRYYYKDYYNFIHIDTLVELKDFFEFIKVDELIIGSLITHENLVNIISFLKEIIHSQHCKSKYLIHDYHSICPNFTLMFNGESFCNIPDFKKCATCLKNLTLPAVLINQDFTTLTDYRLTWYNFLSLIDEVICFAPSVKGILKKAYPTLPESKIKVIPHLIKEYRPITIGVIGNIHSESKGGAILRQMAQMLESKNEYNTRIIILGELAPQFDHPAIQKSGAFHPHILYDLMRKNHIDVFFIPSIWPETFSYTTAEAILTGMPVFCYNLGGQADQVRNYRYGHIIKEIDARNTLQEIIEYMQAQRRKREILHFENSLENIS